MELKVKKASIAVCGDVIMMRICLKNGKSLRFAISERGANELTTRWLGRDTPALASLKRRSA